MAYNEMGYVGWLVIERSRDAKKPSDTKYNYGANAAVFEEGVSVKRMRRFFLGGLAFVFHGSPVRTGLCHSLVRHTIVQLLLKRKMMAFN